MEHRRQRTIAGMTTGRLQARGTRLYDERGREVILRGVNTGGRSKFAPFLPFDFTDFAPANERYWDRIATLGFNVVRMPFSWEALEPTRGRYDDAWLARYVALIDAAWARGIRTFVDFHQDVYATPFSGDGFPLWTIKGEHGPPRHDMADGAWFLQYMDGNGPVPGAFNRFWSNEDGLLDAFEQMWRHMARATKDHPGVIGYEVINEPGWGTQSIDEFEQGTLTEVLSRLGRAIREEAGDVLIFGGGPGVDALTTVTHLRDPGVPGFVYAPHYYDAQINIGGEYAKSRDVTGDISRLVGFGDGWNRPVLFGEFGGAKHSPDLLRFVTDVYHALDATRAHGTIWEASMSRDVWNHEELGLFEPDGTERPLCDVVARPYPRAVAGRIERFSWDGRAFDLAIAEPTDEVTEVYLPARHFGAAAKIVSDGDVQRRSELLLVRGATHVTVTA
jgi:endoglycosylceramidase